MALDRNPVSLVHFMAYPGPGGTRSVLRGEARPEYLLRTVRRVLEDQFFAGIEITGVKDRKVRAQLKDVLAVGGKFSIYCAQPIQLINEDNLIPPSDISSADEVGRQQAVARLKQCVDEAYYLGSARLSLISGKDPGSSSGLGPRRQAFEALARSVHELCAYACEKASESGREPLAILLESFDRQDGPGMKGQLVGPSEEAVVLAARVIDVYQHTNFGLVYDIGHMPLIKGTGFDGETPEVLRRLAPFLAHVHVATSVVSGDDPVAGDTHPHLGYPGGSLSQDTLAECVRILAEAGYSGSIGFEVSPYGDELGESVVEEAKSWFVTARGRLDANYTPGSFSFKPRSFMSEGVFSLITATRISRPQAVKEAAESRVRRETLCPDGRMVILACDHPARYVTAVGDDPVAMGDRLGYLARILRVLTSPRIDGVMSTPDILDDLLIVDWLLAQRGAPRLLDGKLLIGSMNRAGLAGIEYEMDDRMTAYTAEKLKEQGFDGAKMMFRVDPGHHSRYSIQTIAYCSHAINGCNRLGLPVFLEALPVERVGQSYRVKRTAHDLIRVVGVASGLGDHSGGLWLKIPYVEDYHRVTRATTLPVLMLGGESLGNPLPVLLQFERGMGEGENVRGAMVGRNVLYPGQDDPRAVAEGVCRIVHDLVSTSDALAHISSVRGAEMSWLRERLE
ncbi:MAG: TIM barrel protein [Firmicutes bacterium]|nr:TIM barrel protein [Bacillota bacterium]